MLLIQNYMRDTIETNLKQAERKNHLVVKTMVSGPPAKPSEHGELLTVDEDMAQYEFSYTRL